MLTKYINLKFAAVVVPNSLMEKDFGGVVSVAGVPPSALNIEFEALKLTNTIQGFTIGGALDANGKAIQGVYQVTWWNPQNNKNSNNNNNNKNSNNVKRNRKP